MNLLPKGYYAISKDANATSFNFKGVTYEVKAGENLFPSLKDGSEFIKETPDTVISGLDYESFDAPVVLFSAGEHSIDGHHFAQSLILLGQNAGVDPNVDGDPLDRPALNPQRKENETVFIGHYWWGRLFADSIAAETIVIDGVTSNNYRFEDLRSGGNKALIAFKNIIYEGPCSRHLHTFKPIDADSPLDRTVLFENCRIVDYEDNYFAALFIKGNATRIIVKGTCFDNSSQMFGFTDLTRHFPTCAPNTKISEVVLEDCTFRSFRGNGGISTSCHGFDSVGIKTTVKGCRFVNACLKGEYPLNINLANDLCSLAVTDCVFHNDVEDVASAILLNGDGQNVTVTDCIFTGFKNDVERYVAPPVFAPDHIDGTLGSTDTEDSHVVCEGDFTALDALYEGTKAYYGDLHVHTKCGGTSDGGFPMADWPKRMDEIDLDFAAVVDHRQMRGFFLPEWDSERFMMGTEPAGTLDDYNACPPLPYYNEFHYNMLVPHKYGLAMIFANFPEHRWSGTELDGCYWYAHFTKPRLAEMIKFIQDNGGMFVHPHPKDQLVSTDPLDYYYGEHIYFETLYGTYDSHASFKDYDLWVQLLNMGKRVYTSCGSDTHGDPSNKCVATFYTEGRSGDIFFKKMRSADFAAGAVGVKMCIDGHPMGSEIEYKDGMKLNIRLNDFYKHELKDNTAYEFRIYTDKGLAYSSVYNGKMPQEITLQVQKRMYYRCEVFDLTHGYRVSVSNPIWLD